MTFLPRVPSPPVLSPPVLVACACCWAALGAAPTGAAQQDPLSLEGLVVTASPVPRAAASVASHVTVLDGEELRARGVSAVAEALRTVAGLEVARSGSYGATTSVFLRGGESDYTLVLIDGVQVNQPGGAFDFSSLTMDNVERIEILRGPASALYGSDAVSGVIHVITRAGGGPEASLGFRAGSYGRRDLFADYSAGTDRAGYSVSLSRRATDGILAFNNRHVSTVLSGTGRLLPDDRTRVDLSLRVSDRTYHFPTDGAGAVVDRNAFTFAEETTARLGITRGLGSALDVQALIGVSQNDGGTDDRPDGPADTLGFYGFHSLDDFRRASAEVRANAGLGNFTLTGGIEVEHERQRSFTESLSELGPSTGRSESDRDNRAYYVHATGATGGERRLSVNGGARLEDNERFGRSLTWQGGVAWRAGGGAGTTLRAAAGTAIKEPTFAENFATGFARGNPDLDPERSFSWELGVEQSLLGERASISATHFRQRYEDMIQFTAVTPSPTDPSFFNVAAARARGLEVAAALDLGRVGAAASWTWLDTEVTDAGFEEGPGATFVEGAPLLRRPEHALSVDVRARVGAGARVTGAVDFVGARADRDFTVFPARPVELAAHALLSLGAEWDLTVAAEGRPGLTLSVGAANVLDASYQEVYGFRAPGRALQVGGSVRLGGAGS